MRGIALIYKRCYAVPYGLTGMRCSKVVIVGSAKPPRVPGLGVDDEYCEGIITSGAT